MARRVLRTGQDGVLAPAESSQHAPGVVGVARLFQDDAVADHDRVRADDNVGRRALPCTRHTLRSGQAGPGRVAARRLSAVQLADRAEDVAGDVHGLPARRLQHVALGVLERRLVQVLVKRRRHHGELDALH